MTDEATEADREAVLISNIIEREAYTAYTYSAQNRAVEKRRAEKYARLIAREALAAQSAENERLKGQLYKTQCSWEEQASRIDQLRKNLGEALELLGIYVSMVGNTGYSVDRQLAQEIYPKAEALLSRMKGDEQ